MLSLWIGAPPEKSMMARCEELSMKWGVAGLLHFIQ